MRIGDRQFQMAACAGALAFLGAAAARADTVRREVVVDGSRMPVAVHVPADYDAARAWPLVVFLHGAGECGNDGRRQVEVGIGPALAARPQQWPCLVLMPQKPGRDREWEEHEDLILAAIADVRANWNIDGDRIVLTGLSQGGHGTWLIGARHREIFSCLAPVCGYGRAQTVAPRVAGLPVWAFHGLRDDVVDPADTIAIVGELRRLGAAAGEDPAEVRLTLYPEAGHNSWDAAYAEPDLPRWLLAQVRAKGTP